MSDDQRPIIIRRVKKIKKAGHHGGSWKIAYADFVTAMMAFFLLMWLLGLLNKYQLQGVAEYFKKPLKDAFQHNSNQRGAGKNKGDYKTMEKYKEKEKEKDKIKQAGKENLQDKNKEQDKAMTTPDSKLLGLSAETKERLDNIKGELEKKLDADPVLREFKNQLNFQITSDGLKIELRDLDKKPMFTTGKADFQEHAKTIMKWLSNQLNTYPNRIVIIGHTDAAPYENDQYTNWELSADRANATRRALISSGMKTDKIMRVIGVGDGDLLNPSNGLDPSNRRIEIVVLTDDAMKKLESDKSAPEPTSGPPPLLTPIRDKRAPSSLMFPVKIPAPISAAPQSPMLIKPLPKSLNSNLIPVTAIKDQKAPATPASDSKTTYKKAFSEISTD